VIHSDLSASGPLTLSIFSTLETKRRGGFHAQKKTKQLKIWKTYLCLLSGLIFFRSVITVLYDEKTIAIYAYNLFLTICRIGSCNPILSKM
jgi:hypothetical protein